MIIYMLFLKKTWIVLLTIFFLFSNLCIFATDAQYVWSNSVETSSVSSDNVSTTTTEQSSGNFLNLESGGAILMEQSTGKILYEHNIHEKLRPASVTKIMSILLIMEALDSGKIDLNDQVPCSENARSMGGSQIWLNETEQLTVHEMLKAICVVSANDCTVAMAEFLAGTQEAFVMQMNARAKELGMNDTTFKNCHGIDEDGHVTSPYDIALMSRELMMNHPKITEYTTIWMDSLRDGKSELVNTNKLIRNYTGATGLKTGSTSVALYNLSATATRNNLSLIAVVMKAPSTKVRFAEAQKLLDYGFNNYEYKEFAKKGDVVGNIIINKGTFSSVDVIFDQNVGFLLKKGESQNVTQSIDLPNELTAPVQEGQKLGEAIYSNNGEIHTVDLVAKTSVDSLGFFNVTKMVYGNWFNLLR